MGLSQIKIAKIFLIVEAIENKLYGNNTYFN